MSRKYKHGLVTDSTKYQLNKIKEIWLKTILIQFHHINSKKNEEMDDLSKESLQLEPGSCRIHECKNDQISEYLHSSFFWSGIFGTLNFLSYYFYVA